jgi:hypothetical protein
MLRLVFNMSLILRRQPPQITANSKLSFKLPSFAISLRKTQPSRFLQFKTSFFRKKKQIFFKESLFVIINKNSVYLFKFNFKLKKSLVLTELLLHQFFSKRFLVEKAYSNLSAYLNDSNNNRKRDNKFFYCK